MPNEKETLLPIVAPTIASRLTNHQILMGPHLDPLMVITTYSPDEWENFIREWVSGLSGYQDIRRSSGAGDMGRDVVAHVGKLNSREPWDNFQCKHYANPLTPSDIWPELAKLAYYTWAKQYTVPRAYYFVAPKGAGPKLTKLLESPEKLRGALIEEWTSLTFAVGERF